MNDFDILQNFSFGTYRPVESSIHGLHPALKIASLILLAVTVFITPLFPEMPLLFLFFILLSRLAGLKLSSLLRGIRPVLPFLILIVVIQIFFIPREYGGDPLFTLGRFGIYSEDLLFSARIFGRFFCLFLLFSLFTSVTSVSQISHGTELLLHPFSRNGFSHDAALVITITFRFIPLLAMEAEHITKAQASRGASFGTWKTGPVKKMRLYLPLLVPLFTAALERAEILVEAMEARCYEPGRERSRMEEYSWKKGQDGSALAITVITVVLMMIRRIFV